MEITLLDVFREIQSLRCDMNQKFAEQEKRLDKKIDARFQEYDKKMEDKFAEQDKKLKAQIQQILIEQDKKLNKQTAEIAEEIREIVKYVEKRDRRLETGIRKLELANSNL